MGSQKIQQARSGLYRPGPRQRALRSIQVEISKTARLASQNTRQKRCRLRQAEADAIRKEILEAEMELEARERQKKDAMRFVGDKMGDREERRVALLIADSIRSNLALCPGPKSRKSVLKKVLDHKKVVDDLPDHILPSRVAVAYQEVVAGVSCRLEYVKSANSAAKLATKHAILDASVSCHSEASVRQVARVLGVHHRNIHEAINKRELVSARGEFLCTLTVRKKRADGLNDGERNAIICWWVSESRVSPNKKDVTRRRVAPGVHDEKPTHYLQETQVHNIFSHVLKVPRDFHMWPSPHNPKCVDLYSCLRLHKWSNFAIIFLILLGIW